uniref:Polypeptide N-acetylgalactosaminyltransferase n=1 Tax=Arion vulgaris TaxID=1028688 RepID=A0A0B7A7H3_9EUPU
MSRAMTRKKRCVHIVTIMCLLSGIYILWNVIGNMIPRTMPVDFDISLLQELYFAQKLTPHDQKEPLRRFGYDIVRSHAIKPDRSIPDTRHPSCSSNTSDIADRLPSSSIIITFHHVDSSVLLRNILSILTRSLPVIIHEIIVVDDGSSDESDELLSQLPGLKVISNKQSQGRGVARVQGAAIATGDVIVFVDGLVEVNVNWLSPLLLRLMESPKSLVAPVLDTIDYKTFDYLPVPTLVRGGFDWGLHYRWEDVPFRFQARPNPLSPIKSPALCGSVVAVRRDYFNWLGKYDDNSGARDTEDLELSLRVWMCGGHVEIVPCSKVGVVHFKGEQLGISSVSFNSYIRSARRLAEVWMDDYKRFFYAVRPSARMQPIPDIASQRKLKEKLKCRNFKWYLAFVYPQLQPLIYDEVAYGHIQQGDSCIDLDPGQLPIVAKLRTCEVDKDSQEWSWRKKGVIVSSGMCLTSDLMNMQGFVVVHFCKDIANQLWYRHGEKIVHQDTNLCLDGRQGNTGLLISDCIKDSPSQAWNISTEKKSDNPELAYFYSDDDDVDHGDVHEQGQL